ARRDSIPGPTPNLAAVFDDERLRDKPLRQLRRRIPDAEHLGLEPLVIGRRSHLRQSGKQAIAEEHGGSTNPITIVCVSSRTDIEHKAQAPETVSCFIITVSDTRSEATDTSGQAIADLLISAGHRVTGRTIVRDDPALVRSTIERQLAYK